MPPLSPIAPFEALLAAALVALSSSGVVHRYLGPVALGAYLVGVAAVALWFWRSADRLDLRVSPRAVRVSLVVLAIVFVVAFVLVYPMAQSGVLGVGSDRDDALDAGLAALARGEYPYYQRTYLGNELTPLPGAFLLALPAWALGASALQNLMWLPLLLLFAYRWFDSKLVGLAFVAAFAVFNPAALQDLLTGGDYFVNAAYVLMTVTLAQRAAQQPIAPGPEAQAATRVVGPLVLLGIAVCSRSAYIVVPVALAAALWRTSGEARALGALTLVAAVVVALTLPFLLIDAAAFSPLHHSLAKVDRMFPHGTLVLGSASLVTALWAGRRVRTEGDLLGAIGLALATAFVPLLLWRMIAGGYLELSAAATPVSLFGGAFLAKRLDARVTGSSIGRG